MFVRDTASSLFAPGLRKVLVDEFASYDWIYKKLFFVSSTNRRYEDDYSMFGITSIPAITEGANIDFQDTSPGYSQRYTPLIYASGLKWTIEAEEDELYGFFRKFPSFMSKAIRYTIETVAEDIFTDAFTTTGGDGVALFSTSHPMYDGTQANTPAADIDLGLTALENAMITISKTKTWEGHPIDDKQKKILKIHPNEKPMAMKLLGTTNQPFSANNTINYVKDEFELLVTPYQTDTDAWFLLPKPYDGGLMFFWRVKPNVFNDKDPDNLANRVMCRMRFVPGYTQWYGTYGTQGAA